MSALRKANTWIILLTVLVAMMAIEIVYLVYQNQQLRTIIEDPQKYFKAISQKEIVPSLNLMNTDGETVLLSYSPDAPFTVLFWFSPGCAGCEDNFEFWEKLASDTKNNRVRFYGMCIGDVDDAIAFADEQDFPFPTLCVSEQFVLDAYKGGVIPQTVLIAPEGTVLDTWTGKMEDPQKDKILSFLQQFQSQKS
ncbi:MAG: redoxin domain-containing protein [Candidatus Zixiibacteriota bacterium]